MDRIFINELEDDVTAKLLGEFTTELGDDWKVYEYEKELYVSTSDIGYCEYHKLDYSKIDTLSLYQKRKYITKSEMLFICSFEVSLRELEQIEKIAILNGYNKFVEYYMFVLFKLCTVTLPSNHKLKLVTLDSMAHQWWNESNYSKL